ncbi:MAG: 50S ribosomal protein L24 [Balneolaceae bacterium]|jgi:large subunit ribosomal protein L24|nr:50S ribosomal protein L24 [Balneolaceae bacterium]MDR9447308.1 50S ribosomal protein L24 [Balneolaceae bacterium]
MPRKSKSQPKLNVKKGDEVMVIAGNDKGTKGRVLMVFPSKERVLVEGVNLRTHHDKPSQENQQGGRIQREAAIHISNVMVVDPSSGEPTRVGRTRIEADGNKPARWARVAKVSDELIDK